MALGMKSWVGLMAAGCAALALKALPPSALEPPRQPFVLQEELLERALLDDARLANARLQRLRIADRAIPLTLAETGPLAFSVPAGADPEEAEHARSRALEELSGVPPGVKVGLVYVEWREGGHPGAPVNWNGDTEYYFGSREGQAYCVTVLPTWRPNGGRVRLTGVAVSRTRLGLCNLVARHGLPGPAVREWLRVGGTAMAVSPTPSDQRPFAFTAEFGPEFQRRGLLGLPLVGGRYFGGLHSTGAEQCFAGIAEGCATLLLRPGAPWSRYGFGVGAADFLDGTTPLSAIQQRSILEPADNHVAADLLQQFGEERFRRFWTADGDLAAAFQDAFGVGAGEWYRDRASRLVTLQRPGPRVTFRGVTVALLLLSLSAVIAGGWARRRRVA